jgi:hypothetical protein
MLNRSYKKNLFHFFFNLYKMSYSLILSELIFIFFYYLFYSIYKTKIILRKLMDNRMVINKCSKSFFYFIDFYSFMSN